MFSPHSHQPPLTTTLTTARLHRFLRIENAFHELEDFETTAFVVSGFNSLPDDKILDWSKLKQIADDILNCI